MRYDRLGERPPDALPLKRRMDEHSLHLTRVVVNSAERGAPCGAVVVRGQQQYTIRRGVLPRQGCEFGVEGTGVEVPIDQVQIVEMALPVPCDKCAHQIPNLVDFRTICGDRDLYHWIFRGRVRLRCSASHAHASKRRSL